MKEIPAEIQEKVDALQQLLSSSDAVLVGAGAGLSAAAGLSYFDPVWFRQYQQEMAARGYHFAYELVGMRDDEWTPGRKWAYWATHIHYVREVFPPAELYRLLLGLLEGKDWFIVTSNCDRQFYRNGFDMQRVFEYQGNYDNAGCSVHCTRRTWDNHEQLHTVLEHIDHDTFECSDDALPRCPYCGALADICFRGSDWRSNAQRYAEFYETRKDRRLLLLELGVGYNTPGVIRLPFESVAEANSNVTLVRVNTDYAEIRGRTGHPELPAALAGRALSIPWDVGSVLRALHA